MIRNKLHIARIILLLTLILNFSFSSIVMGSNVNHGYCSIEDHKCDSCCPDNSAEMEMHSHSDKLKECGHKNDEVKNILSVCNCNHGPDIESDFLINSINFEKSQIIILQSDILFDDYAALDNLCDNSILDIRINAPPIYISISSFLI